MKFHLVERESSLISQANSRSLCSLLFSFSHFAISQICVGKKNMARSTAVLVVCLAALAKVSAQTLTPFVGELRAAVSSIGPATLNDFYVFIEQDPSAPAPSATPEVS